MEFVLKTNLEKDLPAAIDFNFDQLKKELAERLDYYNGIVVTENEIQPAKKERASLNKLKTALENRRKEVKAQCMAPYEEFEKKVKELVGLIDKPIQSIDSQIKEFDDSKLEEKMTQIKEHYDANIGEYAEVFPFEKFLNEKWKNSGMKVTVCISELHDKVQKAINDLRILLAMKLPQEDSVISVYVRTLDMAAALAEKNRIEESMKAVKKAEKVETPPAKQEEAEAPTPAEGEELKTIKVIFYDTSEAFRWEMKALTEKHGIQYGGIQ